jgi:hypothetical protein
MPIMLEKYISDLYLGYGKPELALAQPLKVSNTRLVKEYQNLGLKRVAEISIPILDELSES